MHKKVFGEIEDVLRSPHLLIRIHIIFIGYISATISVSFFCLDTKTEKHVNENIFIRNSAVLEFREGTHEGTERYKQPTPLFCEKKR